MAKINRKPIDNEVALKLLRRLVDRDRMALEELFLLLHDLLTGYILNLLRDEKALEVVLNGTRDVVWTRAASFLGKSLVSTWVVGIARLKRLEYMRKELRRRPFQVQQAEPNVRSESRVETHDGLNDGPENKGRDVEDEKAIEAYEAQQRREEDKDVVGKCMATLRAKHRDILYLVHWGEYDQEQIGRILGVPLGTVKSRLFEARVVMRKCVDRKMAASNGE